MIERHLDYMQFSAPVNENDCMDAKLDMVSPVQFYTRGYRHPLGYRLYFGNPNSKIAYVVASGDALNNMRGEDKTDAELLQNFLSIGAKFSRIDMAVTEWIEDHLVTLEEVKSWVKEEQITSSLLKYGCKTINSLLLDGRELPETCYIGDIEKRGRLGLFRAYDKGIEWKLPPELITRLELEDRGKKAHNTAKRIAETNDIAGNFRARFDVNHRDFRRLMDSDTVDISRGKSQPGKEAQEENDARWVWLMKQVAPALKKAIQEDLKKNQSTDRLNQFLIKSGLGKRGVNGLLDNLKRNQS